MALGVDDSPRPQDVVGDAYTVIRYGDYRPL